jgi:hypothetical protein
LQKATKRKEGDNRHKERYYRTEIAIEMVKERGGVPSKVNAK